MAADREYMTRVVDDAIEADDDDLLLMSMLRGADLRDALVHHDEVPPGDRDPLSGPFAHVVVDEAQELTDAQWQMLLQRCPSRSFTIVGDRAQARRGFAESWQDRLERIGFHRIEYASLGINYRTPLEVMAAAEPVIRAVLPDANVPNSVRSSGLPIVYGRVTDLDTILDAWLAGRPDGMACVIIVHGGDSSLGTDARDRPRSRRLTPELSKGLEFDLVVLVDPDGFGSGFEGAVDRYVAMTRATRQLVILTNSAGQTPPGGTP